MADDFAVRVTAGSLRHGDPAFVLPHAWTDSGIAVEAAGTGAHLLHTAIAACVLNDLFREAQTGGLSLDGVAVVARGEFDDEWSSTGVTYHVELDSTEDESMLAALLARVDEMAEIPRAVRAGATVVRGDG
jgi:OsmC-like protein